MMEYARGNTNLHASKTQKQDEFYTQLSDIEKELKHYRPHFRGKVVFCNCDDPESSAFWVYFRDNFSFLGLKKLISTHYEKGRASYKLELIGPWYDEGSILFENFVQTPLQGDGDFRSEECVDILKEADLVVTNPPFSLFREYMAQLMEHGKDFLILGNLNAAKYKEIFPLVQSNRIWLGYHCGHVWFRVPEYYENKATDFMVDESGQKWRRMGNIGWFTNLDHHKRHEPLLLFKSYHPDDYPTYLNYDAIEVGRVCDIPCDYFGEMGVPITYFSSHNPEQFEIVGTRETLPIRSFTWEGKTYRGDLYLRGPNGAPKAPYHRIIIRRRESQNPRQS